MALLITLFLMVVVFSALTVGEIILLRQAGFDIVAHLRITYGSSTRVRFFLEAFGVVVFVLGQPIVLTAVVVWAFGHVNPELNRVLDSLQELNQTLREIR